MSQKEDRFDIRAKQMVAARKEYKFTDAAFADYIAKELRRAFQAGCEDVAKPIRDALGIVTRDYVDDNFEPKHER